MADITFTVQCSTLLHKVYVTDGESILQVPDGATLNLDPGEHMINWSMAGKPGDTMTISVAPNCTPATPVPGKAIPPGWTLASGWAVFTVN